MRPDLIKSFLNDPEWSNFLRYQWGRHPVRAVFSPLTLVASLIRRRIGNSHDEASHRGGSEAESFSPAFSPAFSENELLRIKRCALEKFPQEVAAITSQADRILEGVFSMPGGTEKDLGEPVPWQGPFEDPEELYYLNRWYHGVTLAKAFFYTGDHRYVDRFAALLTDWAAKNTPAAGPVWESYSVGERIVSWGFAHSLLAGVPDYRGGAGELLLRLLAAHAEYLVSHLEDRIPHNHLINNARALFLYGAGFPELPNAEALGRLGWSLLMREMNRQILGDGMLGEQSTHYHLLLLSRYAEVFSAARRSGVDVPERYREKFRRMSFVGGLFVRPDRSLATSGDVSPDALPSDPVGPNERSLWLEGAEAGLDECPGPELIHLPESGYAVFRSPEMHLVLHGDPRARVIRHGHQDVLSLQWWARGREILADPGNSSFLSDRWDRFFRGPYAHNTIVVDGLPPYVRSLTLRDLLPTAYSGAQAGLQCSRNGDVFVIEGRHTGYHRLSSPVVVSRRLEIFGDGISLQDRLEGSGEHAAEILFQFGKNRLQAGSGPNAFTVRSPDEKPIAEVRLESETPLSFEVLREIVEPEPRGWISPAYGSKEPGTTLVCRLKMKGEVSVRTRMTLCAA